jgi:NitT/TauT family transport system permease protein
MTALALKAREGTAFPVAVVCLVILVIWYVACIPMNAVVAESRITAAGGGLANAIAISWNLDRPVIPAPHQIIVELRNSVLTVPPWAIKSLVYHSWVTLSSTLLGFILGALLGIGLAIAIVHSKLLSQSLMPWIIASQTIPILAIAPMIIVVLGAINFAYYLPWNYFSGANPATFQAETNFVAKSIISSYLCFFPVTIGMVKGLTSPEPMQLDLTRTYNASRAQVLWKLRFPASVPFLFASLKVAVAIALVGAIVGELPTGAQAGIGARLLNGSYYGQTVQIWAALFAASFVAAALVWLIGVIERAVAVWMGAKP